MNKKEEKGDGDLFFSMYQIDYGHLRRCQESDGWTPCAGAAAQIEKATVQFGELTGSLGIK